jgi:hypothetical protein
LRPEILDRDQQINPVFSHPVVRSSVGNRVGKLRQAFPHRDAPPTLDRDGLTIFSLTIGFIAAIALLNGTVVQLYAAIFGMLPVH